MSVRRLYQSFSHLAADATLFLDPSDDLSAEIQSLIRDLQQVESGTQQGCDLVSSAVEVISKLKTKNSVSLPQASVAPDHSARLKDPRAAVEDRFFKLSELETFLDQQDHQFERQQEETDVGHEDNDDEDEEVDMFADVSDDEIDAKFDDFFDGPAELPDFEAGDSQMDDQDVDEDDEDIDTTDFTPSAANGASAERDMVIASDSESGDSGGEEAGPKSAYQKKKEGEEKRIRQLEQELLQKKSWQLSGEVDAGHRPSNSLLEEHLQFDFLSRQAPQVTEDFSHQIEDIIKQRIRNESWDDVVRKTKPTEQAFEFKRRITLEQEKSKSSLAQIYEKEYTKSTGQAVPEKEDPAHTKIMKMARTLYAKLDSLSSFHFTPRQPEPELKLISNLPAVSAEEAIPVAVSESTLLAPEEVSRKQKRELMSATEKTDTDRKRERRGKKRFQKAKKLFVDRKKSSASDLVSQNKYVRLQREQAVAKALKKLPADKLTDSKVLRSSKSFFAQLDDKVTQAKAGKTKAADKPKIKAKSLKL